MLQEEIVIQTDGSGRKLQRYVKKEVIGNGGFARCYLMINQRTGEKFAGKVIKRKELKDKTSRNKIMQEIQIHKALDHNHVVKFYDMFEFEGEIYIILELCQNNSLKQFLKSRVRITEFQAKCYMHQILEGVEYLHNLNILHRDIKLGNIFLNYKMEIKIGDFGLSTKLKGAKERRYTTCGTPNYIAPEILNQGGHSFQVDIWAIGIILYALLFGKPPFESQTVQDTYRKIKENDYEFPKNIPISNEAKSLIKSILEPNPKQRISLANIKMHDFLNKSTQNLPLTLPPYTISIPPQNNYLKQYISDKHMKLSIYPRKISNVTTRLLSCEDYNSNASAKGIGQNNKIQRVLSIDKNAWKMNGAGKEKSYLNKGIIYNSKVKLQLNFALPHTPKKLDSARSAANLLSPARKYEDDGTEIICYYDMSQKYGIGYLLSNGNCGVIFNDQTSLTKLIDKSFIFFHGQQDKIKLIGGPLEKKSEILKFCIQKLNDYKEKNVLIDYFSEVYVKKFIRFKEMLAMKLSNNIFQFFWNADSITLRGYKWIKWRINGEEGDSTLTGKGNSQALASKVTMILEFFKINSLKSVRPKPKS